MTSNASEISRLRLLAAMAGVGVYATLAQILMLREFLVVFFGNELTIGAILSIWLVEVSLGALAIRPLVHRLHPNRLLLLIIGALVTLLFLLPAQIALIRILRAILQVPMGEAVSFGALLTGAGLTLLPTGLIIGLIFPCVCQLAGQQDAGAVSRLYALESLGSMIGGLLFSFLLVAALKPLAMAALAGLVLALSVALLTPSRWVSLRRLPCNFTPSPSPSRGEGIFCKPSPSRNEGIFWKSSPSRGEDLGEGEKPTNFKIFILVLSAVLGGVLLVLALYPPALAGLEWQSIQARWRAFGVLPPSEQAASETTGVKAPRLHNLSAASGAGLPSGRSVVYAPSYSIGTARLLASVDSRYQNLAVIAAEGQKTLYADGQVMAVYPDPVTGEHTIHFIMAQKPNAVSVLLIGGNPVTDLPELLKYPLRRLVHVELDPEIPRLLAATGDQAYRQALQDQRLHLAHADGPRYIKTCREVFDVILVMAPGPTTIALNRYYTLDFYREIRRRLTSDGFCYTAIEASDELQDEAARLSASLDHTLRRVFSRVLVTAGPRNQFFASAAGSSLTFDREELYRRSAGLKLHTQYFRPEYFLNADEISPEKTAFVAERLRRIQVPLNTSLQPISTFYQLVLWSRFSGSRLEPWFQWLASLRYEYVSGGILGFGALVLSAAVLIRIRRRTTPPGLTPKGLVRIWPQAMLGLVLALTGLCGMALEVVFIFTLQSLYGYVYALMGLIVAMFMLGLCLGSLSAARLVDSSVHRIWVALIGLELVLLGLALAVPVIMTREMAWPSFTGAADFLEIGLYVLTGLLGWCVGAQFPLVNRLLRDTMASPGSAAAWAYATDLLGATFGGLIMGVWLLPLWGMTAACLTLAAVTIAGLICLSSAYLLSDK